MLADALAHGVLPGGVLEALPPHARVPDRDRRGLRQVAVRPPDDRHADRHHGYVPELVQCPGRRDVLALPGHLLVLREHVEAGHTHVREPRVADVRVVRVDLWTHFAHLHSRHQRPLVVPELDHKAVDAVVFPADQELRKHDAMGASVHARGPPLQRGQRGRMDDKFVGLAVVLRNGLEPAHIGTVAELGLGVSAEVPRLLGRTEPLLLLFLTCVGFQERQKHRKVDPEGPRVKHLAHPHFALHMVQHELPVLGIADPDDGLRGPFEGLAEALLITPIILHACVIEWRSTKQWAEGLIRLVPVAHHQCLQRCNVE
mmetsp:Transcript_70837/g.217114  ORF Transcript_70837/g.217114 Transcript_70837/m.217114 type:complete len:315 (+) Transcript_70837:958-1902(+)